MDRQNQLLNIINTINYGQLLLSTNY